MENNNINYFNVLLYTIVDNKIVLLLDNADANEDFKLSKVSSISIVKLPYDKELEKNVKIDGNVDTNKEGEYILNYSVSDNSGNIGTARRKVIVKKGQLQIKVVSP